MSTDDEEGESGPKPSLNSLDSIMIASCIDDWGSNGMVQSILEYCWSWHHRRINNSALGCPENMVSVKMAGQETKTANTA